MKSKIKKEFNRLEMAEHLEKIARQLRSGIVDAQGRQTQVALVHPGRV
jgi:hypothetical protein